MQSKAKLDRLFHLRPTAVSFFFFYSNLSIDRFSLSSWAFLLVTVFAYKTPFNTGKDASGPKTFRSFFAPPELQFNIFPLFSSSRQSPPFNPDNVKKFRWNFFSQPKKIFTFFYFSFSSGINPYLQLAEGVIPSAKVHLERSRGEESIKKLSFWAQRRISTNNQ